MVFSNDFSSENNSVTSSSYLTVKTGSYSGVKPPCNLSYSLDLHLFARDPNFLIAVSAAFFAGATEIFNPLMIMEGESDEEESSSTLSFRLVAIILASMDYFIPDLLTSH